ncbi:hypothetical protein GCM10027575_27430 [Phytohabitans suffuscus]
MPSWACEHGYASTTPAGTRARSASPISANGATAATGSVGAGRPVSHCARWAIERRSNRSRTSTSNPAVRSAPARPTARIESPPTSKKLSSTLTRGRPSTSVQTPAIRSSTVERGATYGWSVEVTPRSGDGRARLSSFPLVVNGIRATGTNADGIM